MAQHLPPPDVIPGTILRPQDKTHYLGAIISCDPIVAPWENALAKALARLKAWSKRNLSIHNRTLIVRTMILPTVDNCTLQHIIAKAIPLSERLAQCPHLTGHVNTKKLIKLARTHRL